MDGGYYRKFFFIYSMAQSYFFVFSFSKMSSSIFGRFSYIIIIILVLASILLHQHKLVIFPWRLNDSKSLHISGFRLRVLADLKDTVYWMVSVRPPISNSSSLHSKLLETVTSAPIIISITVILMVHRFLISLFCKVKVLVFIFIFFHFRCGQHGPQSPPDGELSFPLFFSLLVIS